MRLISGRDALRCRSEMKRTAKGPLDDFCPLVDYVLDRDVGEEVLDCFRRALGVQVERNDAEVRVQPYHGVSLTWPGSASPTRSPRASAGRFRVARRSRSAPWRSALRYPSPLPPARTPRI